MTKKTYLLNFGFLLLLLVSSCHSSEKKAPSNKAETKYSLNYKSSSSKSFMKKVRGQNIAIVINNEMNQLSTEKADSSFVKSVMYLRSEKLLII